MALHNKILLGLVLGAVAGVTVNLMMGGGPGVQWFVGNITEPIGRVWLNGLIMVVIPLVLSTLALGVAGLGSVTRLGKIGGITLLSFLGLTTLAASLGLTLVNLIRPGSRLDETIRVGLMEAYKGQSDQAMGLAQGGLSINTFVNIVPRNPIAAMANGEMLAVIFMALMLGIALTRLTKTRAQPMLSFLDSLAHVTIQIIDIVMKFAPWAVACLIFSVTARFGFDLLFSLATYVITVLLGLSIFMVVIYALILKFVVGVPPLDFFRKARVVILTAFSTSSSNATLPTTLRVTEERLGVPNEIAGFVVPLGATTNMNGTALFEGVTVLFVAQVFGVTLTFGQQVVVVLMSVLVAIGAAGVPGGSIPLLMMVLGMVGVPMEGIAIVLGVDRILDMCRTTVNVAGDMITAKIVHKYAGFEGGTSIIES
ncbi:MAG: dicarboxylate/amino acid:cation symporter [Vicinamibacterales bacterium]